LDQQLDHEVLVRVSRPDGLDVEMARRGLAARREPIALFDRRGDEPARLSIRARQRPGEAAVHSSVRADQKRLGDLALIVLSLDRP
jgi:hypothetical protein